MKRRKKSDALSPRLVIGIAVFLSIIFLLWIYEADWPFSLLKSVLVAVFVLAFALYNVYYYGRLYKILTGLLELFGFSPKKKR